ncbi:MAG: SUF system Fe-S cluster assembly protein [Gammaproteobacteria bacterium]|nr:SUF system Fe-S cluster assembly protein [Gammaproteobacteria bacterium]
MSLDWKNFWKHNEETESRNLTQEDLKQKVIAALRTVYDPEIPVNIYDLGLIYDIAVDTAGKVAIEMTLTAPGCPVAQTFPGTVEAAVRKVEGVTEAGVELVWEPPWSMEQMSEAAKLQLGML